jgi:hypothetical protein
MSVSRGHPLPNERTWFVRPVPRRPKRFFVELGDRPHVSRQLAAHPSRFVVGLDDFDTAERKGNPPVRATNGGVVRLEHYVGRVVDVAEGGDVIVRVWQRPNGREGTAVLSWDGDFPGEKPVPGSVVYIWAWLELPGDGEVVRRRFVEVENKVIDSAGRGQIADLLARLSETENLG